MRRRDFLGAAALAAVPAFGRTAQRPDASFPGMIARETEPPNLEFPFSSLDGYLVPNERFYVRNHFPTPKVDAATWKLRVEGAVERPVELSLDEVKRLPAVTRPLTLECAGNGRVYLAPKVRGVAWQLGAVGNAEWTGVPLAAVLERAGVKAGAVEVVLEGADTGSVNDDPKSPGPIHFARSLPLDKARRPEVLLAYGMNGAGLPTLHGAPLRAVVGGWYGMASVKWLTRVVVTDRPFAGFWQTFDYSQFVRENGLPVMRPITEMQVKASIARPVAGAVVPAKGTVRVFGAAWAGEADVAKVEVSGDGGTSWAAATLGDKNERFAWRLWDYQWTAPARPGRAALMARATDSRGRTQPDKREPDRRTYMISHMVPVEVEVR